MKIFTKDALESASIYFDTENKIKSIIASGLFGDCHNYFNLKMSDIFDTSEYNIISDLAARAMINDKRAETLLYVQTDQHHCTYRVVIEPEKGALMLKLNRIDKVSKPCGHKMLNRSYQETKDHVLRLSQMCSWFGKALNLDERTLEDLIVTAKLHDLGKASIHPELLEKEGLLSSCEWEVIRQHPVEGRNIVKSIPGLEHIAKYILHHHERWDGTGYPDKLMGNEIPYVSRIIAILDAFDAMTHERAYKRAQPVKVALEEIGRNAGKQFDPDLAKKFLETLGETGLHMGTA